MHQRHWVLFSVLHSLSESARSCIMCPGLKHALLMLQHRCKCAKHHVLTCLIHTTVVWLQHQLNEFFVSWLLWLTLLSSLLPAGTHHIVFARNKKKKCTITLTFSLQCSMPHDTTHQPPFLYLAKPLLPTVVAWCHILCGFCQVCVLLPFSHRNCKSVLLWHLSTSVQWRKVGQRDCFHFQEQQENLFEEMHVAI